MHHIMRTAVFMIAAFLFFQTALPADTVVLNSGRRFRNVKTVLKTDSVFLIFKDGSLIQISKRNLKTILRRPVENTVQQIL